jgi:hypothetical protein
MDVVQVMKLIMTSYMTLGIPSEAQGVDPEKNKDKVTTADVT